MFKLAKLLSPSNQRYAKSPYAGSTKSTKNTFFPEKSRRENIPNDLSLYQYTNQLGLKEPRQRLSQPTKPVRNRSYEGCKPKPGNKSLNISVIDDGKLKASKSTTRVPRTRAASRRINTNSEIDSFLKDLTSADISERRNLEILFLSKWIDTESDIRYLISGTWIEKYAKFLGGDTEVPPGEIDNHSLKDTPLNKDCIVFSVNEFIWCFLNLLYGGGPDFRIPGMEGRHINNEIKYPSLLILTDEKPSLDSQKIAPIATVHTLKRMSLHKRKENENKFLKLHMNTKTRLNYFVNEDWIDEYLKYLNGNGAPPGPIDNSSLKQKFDNKLCHGDCYTLNEIVWNFLSILYDANPDIGIRELVLRPGPYCDIFDGNFLMQKIDQRRKSNKLPNPNEQIRIKNLSQTTKSLLGLPLRNQENSDKRDPNCVVCIDRSADTIFIPCGHRCCCYPDAQETIKKFIKCPLCKNVIEGFMKSFEKKNTC